MPAFEIRLFGKFCALREGQAVNGLEAIKVQELLCYLLIHRDRAHSRENLASLLWGDHSTSQSKKYLRQTLWQLQAALDPPSAPGSGRLLLVDSEWVRLNPDADLWLDIAVFDEAVSLANGTRGSELEGPRARGLQRAVELYTGDLLDGCYQDWCLNERERLLEAYLASLEKLVSYCEKHGFYDAGLAYGGLVVRSDCARESAHRQLMRLLYLSGNRTAALRQYERCVAALDREFGVRPGKLTVELYEQIRADRAADISRDGGEEALPQGRNVHPIPDVLDRLRQLHTLLVDAQRQLQHDIGVVERALGAEP